MDSIMLGSLTFYRRVLHQSLFNPHRMSSSPSSWGAELHTQTCCAKAFRVCLSARKLRLLLLLFRRHLWGLMGSRLVNVASIRTNDSRD